jgi:hypothetical protein
MSLKAILTTLILGSSTVALAQPGMRDHRTVQAPMQARGREMPRRDFGGRAGFVREPVRVERPVVREPVRFERPVVREPVRVERPIVREPVRVERPIVREPVRVERPIVREPVRVERPIVRDHRFTWDRDRYRYAHSQWERLRWVRPIYRDGYFVRPYVYESSPIYLSAAPVFTAPFAGFIDGAISISLGGAAGTGIELSTNGATFVQEAVITYVDGRTEVVQIGQELDASNPAIDLATDGSPVASVTVYGQGAGITAYTI